MKKLVCLGVLFFAIIGMSSCSYDDSNDIDIIIPGDSTQGQFIDYEVIKT